MTHDFRLPTPLIGAAQLQELAAASSRHLRLLDARGRGERAYREGHLPGALCVDLERQLASPGPDPAQGGRHPLPALDQWCRTVGEWGIGPGTAVVVYDDAGGANAAARTWWMLRAAGHRQVAVLDGGLAAAREAGAELTGEVPEVEPRPPYPAAAGGAWQLPVVDAEQVNLLRADPHAVLIDARAAFRFRGEDDPFDPVAGHIPGALNSPYAASLDESGRFRAPGQLRADFERLLGGRDVAKSAVYCGSGVTACHVLLALEHAGLAGAALYVGSWSEWCRSDRPVGTVLPPSSGS